MSIAFVHRSIPVLLLIPVLIVPGRGLAEPTTAVLTLAEAADLLRVEPQQLLELARSGGVPGRRIGVEWRFSRAGLLSWLAGAPHPEAGAHGPPPTLPEAGLYALRGRGPGRGGTGQTVVGEEPDLETAEDVFLRGQRVLLGPGEVVLEPAVFYSRADTRPLGFVDIPLLPGGLAAPGLLTLQQDTMTATLIGRYGLIEETELFGGFVYQLQEDRFELLGEELTDTDSSSALFAGLRRTLVHERGGVPDVIVSLQGRAPTDDSSWAGGGAVSLVKSLDPAVLFGSVEYRHVFARELDDVSLLEAEDSLGVTLGYAFAVNDELTLSTALSGLFRRREDFSDVELEGREEFSLRFGMTRMLGRGRYIEPTVTFLLNGGGGSMTFGLSMPYLANP